MVAGILFSMILLGILLFFKFIYLSEKANDFASNILKILSVEMKTIDAPKLVSGINLYSGFIGFNISTRNHFISQLLLLLQHRFPKVFCLF